MPNIAIDTDVLIVGAGPVGLFLANECARRGLRWRLIEARPSQSEHSKALAIFPRTLEIFDMAGVVPPFLEAANQVTSVTVVAHDHTLAHMPFKPEESPYPFIAMVPQNETEKLLAEQLRRENGAIEYETSFVSAVQNDEFVNITMDQKGQRRDLTAAFVVGCDGAHSAVRHLLNLPFDGAEYHHLFMLADIETNKTLPADQLQLCPNEFGPLAIFPMSATRRRIVATIPNAEGDAPSLDLVKKMLSQRAPRGIEARALHWSSYFHIHHRHVAQLRQGRIFIAGDAAHIHSPFGAQGMNTGLHDVWNLVWKLDLVLRGHGNEQLLDSYSTERLPVIKHVIDISDFLTKAMATPNKFAQALRDAVIPMVSRLAPFQHAFVQRLSELGVAYHGSPIVEGPGKRYIDDSMRGGKGILSRFILMLGNDVESSTVDAARLLARSFSDIVELRLPRGQGVVLVRPDGYTAYSKYSGDSIAALRSVRLLIESQTNLTGGIHSRESRKIDMPLPKTLERDACNLAPLSIQFGEKNINNEDRTMMKMTQPAMRKELLTAIIDGSKHVANSRSRNERMNVGIDAPLHLHPCPTGGVTTEGKIVFETEAEQSQHLKTGDAFYEPAGVRVAKFNNDGDTPAKFVAFYLLSENEKATIQLLEK